MAWTTPVEWPVPAPVGEADFDRIEGNNKYLREENKIINGTNTFTNNITQTGGVTSLLATTINGDINLLGSNRTLFGALNTSLFLNARPNDAAEYFGLQINGEDVIKLGFNKSISLLGTTITGVFKTTGTVSSIKTSSEGNTLFFDRASANYIWAEAVAGNILIGTNGGALSAANSSINLPASGNVLIGGLATDNGRELQVAGSIYASGTLTLGDGATLTSITWLSTTAQSVVYAKLNAIITVDGDNRSILGYFGINDIALVARGSSSFYFKSNDNSAIKTVINVSSTMGSSGKLVIISN